MLFGIHFQLKKTNLIRKCQMYIILAFQRPNWQLLFSSLFMLCYYSTACSDMFGSFFFLSFFLSFFFFQISTFQFDCAENNYFLPSWWFSYFSLYSDLHLPCHQQLYCTHYSVLLQPQECNKQQSLCVLVQTSCLLCSSIVIRKTE